MPAAKRLRESATGADGTTRLEIAAASDIGNSRDENQDGWRVVPFQHAQGCGLLLADGMGGHINGGESARIALDAAAEVLAKAPEPHGALAEAFFAADVAVGRSQSPGSSGRDISGTTLVGATISGGRLQIANVGDSRAYLASGDHWTLLTVDHSLVIDQLRSGAITEEQAATMPSSPLTRAVTGAGDPPDFFTFNMDPGDLLMLCSDGLWGVLAHSQLQALFCEGVSPEALVERACDSALRAGSQDNVTAMACRRL